MTGIFFDAEMACSYKEAKDRGYLISGKPALFGRHWFYAFPFIRFRHDNVFGIEIDFRWLFWDCLISVFGKPKAMNKLLARWLG